MGTVLRLACFVFVFFGAIGRADSQELNPYELVLEDRGFPGAGGMPIAFYYPVSEILDHTVETALRAYGLTSTDIEEGLGILWKRTWWPFTRGRFHIRVLASTDTVKTFERLRESFPAIDPRQPEFLRFYFTETAQELLNKNRALGGVNGYFGIRHDEEGPSNAAPIPEGPEYRHYLAFWIHSPQHLSIIKSVKPLQKWPTVRSSPNWCKRLLRAYSH